MLGRHNGTVLGSSDVHTSSNQKVVKCRLSSFLWFVMRRYTTAHTEFQLTVDWWRFLVFLGWPHCWFCLRQCSVLTRGVCNSKSQNPLLLSVVIDEGLDGVMQQEPANHCVWNSCFCISLKTNTWSITAVRLASLLPSIHSVIHASTHPSIFTQYPLCLDTSPSSSRIIPRHSQDSRVLQSLPHVLLLTRGLLLAPYAWDTSPGRLPGAIWYRCLTPSAPTTFQVIKLPTLSLR